jgi:hypothetical protein
MPTDKLTLRSPVKTDGGNVKPGKYFNNRDNSLVLTSSKVLAKAFTQRLTVFPETRPGRELRI